MTVGEILRRHRRNAGMSQSAIAKAVGCSLVSWSNWERNITAPSPGNAARVSEWLALDAAEDKELMVALSEHTCLRTGRCRLGRGHEGGCGSPRPIAELRDRIAGLRESIDELIHAGNEMSLIVATCEKDVEAAGSYIGQWNAAVDEAARRREASK